MLKIFYSLLLVCLFSMALFAQQTEQEEYFDPNFKGINDSLLQKPQSNISAGLSAGSMFISSNYGNMFSSYIAPSVGYKLSDNFRVNGGLMFMQNNFFGLKNSELNYYSKTNYNTLMFVQGEYLLNKNVILRGTIIKDLNNFSDNFNYDAYSLGMDYKISNNSSIGFELQFSRSNQPFYHSPGFGSTFGNNHFYNINQ